MNLARINNILTVAIVAINLFIFCMPFVPQASFLVRQKITHSAENLDEQIASDDVPEGKRLVIPQILLDDQVFEGANDATLNKGLWHQPNGVWPGQSGATIIAGHRFTYKDPEGAFYHLDKLNNGDTIALYWDGAKHLYSVTNKKIVGADYKIEPGNTEQLVLYTCTPIWNPVNRLVIIAQKQGES